ncbi:MAG: hypothetical protein WC998_02345 [Candidatus Paceibacterota bacterium]|jgi:hypothetical protein
MENLKQIDEKELKKIIEHRDFADFVKTKNKVILYSPKNTKEQKNPLLDIEIALRKCERTGFFKNRK